ncbi:MAG: hypothetical protein CGW95_11465 [Phenylobacterium zucineum]|nr:MAG: hypothetical protein CGW95_11465 [Phenylobacterium zucineum]
MRLRAFWRAYERRRRASLVSQGNDPEFAKTLASIDARTRERLAKVVGLDLARTLRLGYRSIGDGTVKISGDLDQIPNHLRSELLEFIERGVTLQM